jgi:pSer/pThr/pTyr-binding forkhead associated (FHA) protein
LAEGIVCAECGHRNPDGANFCSSCGAPLVHEEQPTGVFHPDDLIVDPSQDDIRVERGDLPPDVGVLVLKSGADVGLRHVLSAPLTTAGRHPRSDIFLDDITVSRRHVEVSRSPSGYVLRDVGSLNGTYVNRERIDEATLSDGDEVQIGKFKLVFFGGRQGS